MRGDVPERASAVNRERKEPAISREFDGIDVPWALQALNTTPGVRFENLEKPMIRQREKISIGSG